MPRDNKELKKDQDREKVLKRIKLPVLTRNLIKLNLPADMVDQAVYLEICRKSLVWSSNCSHNARTSRNRTN